MGALIFKAGLTALVASFVYLVMWRCSRSNTDELCMAVGVYDYSWLTLCAIVVFVGGLIATALGAILWLWGL